jgi:hypothetical protein
VAVTHARARMSASGMVCCVPVSSIPEGYRAGQMMRTTCH